MSAEYSFGAWVRRRRRALDLTQSTLARRVGCATVTIQKIEADERHPSRQVADLLADHLAIPAEQRVSFIAAARAERLVDALPAPTSVSGELAIRPAPALPDGILTFLFADIAGSTTLWEHHPVAMAIAQERHDAILQAAISSHHGQVFKTVGDGVCAVFANARDALDAAIAAQYALQAEPWPTDTLLQVRMAIHTGLAARQGDDYLGLTLSRIQRLLSISHGGQVLLSRAAYELLADTLPVEVTLRDLGVHTLKDLSRAEQVFQVVTPDLPQEFPPLRSADDRRIRLPAPPTPLIGREQELAVLVALLQQPNARLVTLTGPGGSGKTRLALAAAAELAESYADGVVFVDLAVVREPQAMVGTIMRSLGVMELPGSDPMQTLLAFLRRRELLLLIDNLEQVVEGAPLLAEVLAGAPGLTLLATSRVPLQLRAEHLLPVPPLALPPLDAGKPASQQADRLTQYDAVKLFIERGQAVRPGFAVTNANAPAVAEICRRLDGLPLAIELAAARLRLFTPEALLAHLAGAGLLATLRRGPRDLPARQQTLRATIQWSYDLLEPQEQALLARLSVFAGGWTLDAAAAVAGEPMRAREPVVGQGRGEASAYHGSRLPTMACGADALPLHPSGHDRAAAVWVTAGIATLLEHSLVRAVERSGDAPRFVMLETLREFAAEQLHANPEELWTTRRRHAEYFGQLAQTMEERFFTAADTLTLRQLEAEASNLRTVMEWALADEASAERAQLALWPARGMFWLWLHHEPIVEGSHWLARALAATEGCAPSAERVYAWLSSGWLSIYSEDSAAIEQAAAALTQARQLGVPELVFGALWLLSDSYSGCNLAHAIQIADEALELARRLDTCRFGIALFHRAVLAMLEGDMARSVVLFEQSLEQIRGAGATFWLGEALILLGVVYRFQGDIARGRALSEECLALWRQLGARRETLSLLRNLVMLARNAGDYASAARYAGELLAQSRDLGEPGDIAGGAVYGALIAFEQGDDEHARRLAAEALDLSRSANDDYALACALWMTGLLALKAGNIGAAATISAECMAHAQRAKDWPPVLAHSLAGQIAAAQGDYALAINLLNTRLELREARINRWERAEGLADLGCVLLAAGELTQATAYLEQALEIYRIYGSEPRIAVVENELERCRP